MRKPVLCKTLLWVCFASATFTSCVKDDYLANPPAVQDQSFIEEFDTLSAAYNRGWRLKNRSVPIGPTNWNQVGDPQFGLNFVPYSATGGVGYIETDNFSTSGDAAGDGIISNWVISPVLNIQNGDKIVFYTNSSFVETAVRLQVRLNRHNTGLEVGTGNSVGDFDLALLDINGTYSPTGYPDNWTRFEATVYGLDKPVMGRFAFRYYNEFGFVDDPALGVYDCVALDRVSYISKK